jgi:hypothetical protein
LLCYCFIYHERHVLARTSYSQTKRNESFKLQAPTIQRNDPVHGSGIRPNIEPLSGLAGAPFDVWCLEFLWMLELGIWRFPSGAFSNGLHLAGLVVKIVSESEKLGWQRFL